jgi:hypothetical protein
MNVISNLSKIDRILPGDKFTWNFDISCRSGRTIPKGSVAEVIEKSGMTPHNEIMECGYNLLIKTAGAVSIWATFEQCYSRGLLTKI